MPGEPLTELAKVWHAMTELYLDQEFGDVDARWVAEILAGSHYSDAELLRILLDDVHPVFWGNLATTAGEWAGFEQNEVVSAIMKRKSRKAASDANEKYAILRWISRRRRELAARAEAAMSRGVRELILKEWALVQVHLSTIRKGSAGPSHSEGALGRPE